MSDKKKKITIVTRDKGSKEVSQTFMLYDFSIEKIIEFAELIDTLEGMEG